MINEPLKIVHLSTYINGGAGTAAYRIHESLLEIGVHSTFLCTDVPVKDNARSFRTLKIPNITMPARLIRYLDTKIYGFMRLRRVFQSNERLKSAYNKIRDSLDAEFTSMPFSAFNITGHPLVMEADIVHLHWISGFVDFSFFPKIDVPLVWTFHDMNPFKGIFHYDDDEKRNPSVAVLNRKVFEFKKQQVKKIKKSLTCVTPSRWLEREAIESGFFDSMISRVIPYPIDLNVFIPQSGDSMKMNLGIPEDNVILLFVAHNVDIHRKGFDLLQQALQSLGRKISVLVIGNNVEMHSKSFQTIYLGLVYDDSLLSKYYSLADAFVVPSREDNLPNVMLEALACGTPVISFDVGGMSGTITDWENGLKSKSVTASDLSETLKKFIDNRAIFNKMNIRKFAEENFNNKKIGMAYLDIYHQLIANSK